MTDILKIQDLEVAFTQKGITRKVVKGISFNLKKGKTTALVGESGSGKSVTALSILKLLPYPLASHPKGEIIFDQKDLIQTSENDMLQIRGRRIAMIFQEPMTSLNPLHTIEKQISEVLFIHLKMNTKAVRQRVIELLHLVGFPDGANRLNAYPHELSGGQRQRVMIAMALASNPDVLIADEPTTALDVTTQAKILELLKDLQEKLGLSILMITHDLGIVRKMAHEVCVMHEGALVEKGEVSKIFKNPQHPYTQHLLASEPKGVAVPLSSQAKTQVDVKDLKVYFPIKSGFLRKVKDYVRAVDKVSFHVQEGETLGIVGESGSGKSTIAFALLRLIESRGSIVLGGQKIDTLLPQDLKNIRRVLQIVFQDPFGSLSPRLTVGQIIGEGLGVHFPHLSPFQKHAKILQALKDVRLDETAMDRYPHEFSGGQRQRIAIARALILDPKLLILDEPTSALDRSIQVEILDLLKDIQKRLALSYIFISHDLKVVRSIAHRMLVLQKGKVVEEGETQKIFQNPQNDYTKLLIESALE